MADTLNDALAVIRAATLLSGDLQEGRLVVLRRWHRRVWWVDRGGTCPARASTRCSALHRVARSRLFWVAAITSDIRKWRRCAVRKSLSADCVLRSNPPPIPVQRRQCFRFKRAAVSDPLPPPTFHARVRTPPSQSSPSRRAGVWATRVQRPRRVPSPGLSSLSQARAMSAMCRIAGAGRGDSL